MLYKTPFLRPPLHIGARPCRARRRTCSEGVPEEGQRQAKQRQEWRIAPLPQAHGLPGLLGLPRLATPFCKAFEECISLFCQGKAFEECREGNQRPTSLLVASCASAHFIQRQLGHLDTLSNTLRELGAPTSRKTKIPRPRDDACGFTLQATA